MANKKTQIKVSDMSCAACSTRVEKNLNKLEGVSAHVNLATDVATIEFDDDSSSIKDLVETIENTGYGVKLKNTKIKIDDMTCAACAQKIENNLNKSSVVKSAVVNIATDTATVEYLDGIDLKKIIKIIEDTGYSVVDPTNGETNKIDEDQDKIDKAFKKMRNSWLILIPMMIWMIPMMFFDRPIPNHQVTEIGMMVLAVPILFVIGRKIYIIAYKSVRSGGTNMDVLIAIGTGAAFLTGPLSFFSEISNYSAAAAMMMTFHLTGKYIETKARGKASQAIKKLMELGAKTAIVQRNGESIEVPINEVVVGDVMIIKPGAKVPTDGIVVSGSSSIDESMATGESMPVKKNIDDEVIGATINQKGNLKVKATKVGQDTFLSQVIKMVEEAQGTKVPIQAFADKVTSVFVPTILVIALLTFITWLVIPSKMNAVANLFQGVIPWINTDLNTTTAALFATIAVLVIACPCALGLATPTALMVGTGMGAENGVLIRKGEAIQSLKEVRMIVFDKTGTITKGSPEVTDIKIENNRNEMLQYAASVEELSEHPLSLAIINKAKADNLELLPVEDFESITGKGVKGMVNASEVLIGNEKLMRDSNIDIDSFIDLIKDKEKEMKTVMMVAIDQAFAGIIAVSDPLKEDSVQAINELTRLGFKTAMISGDNKNTAQAIANEVGIDHVVAEVLPDGKVEEIKKLQDSFGVIAMVGDGINDAPALVQADVGMAIGTGTDIAIESADVTIVNGRLSTVISAIKLSQETFKKIKQNLFWAFFYNVIMVPVAIMGLMHPIIAEAAMAFSSISVVSNANLLRLKSIKPDYLKK